MTAAPGVQQRRPHCGVVIPTFDGAHVLRTCLDALLESPPAHCSWTLVVVDDASRDRTADLLAEYAGRVTTASHEENRGFAHACNTGARAAGDVDHLVFLNNDTVPLAGWLDALVEEVERDPRVGAVGARLLYPDGTVQHAGVTIAQDGWPRHLYTAFPGEHPAVLRPKRVAAATAACLLVRRDVFDALDGFDTAYVNGYEDIDFCLRLGEAGHEVRYAPNSVLYHLESVTRWPTGKPESTEHNDALYRARWLGRIEPDDVHHYVADGLLRLHYGAFPPVRVEASPLLATTELDGRPADELVRLLRIRTAQALDARGTQTRAGLETRRVEEEARHARRRPSRSAPPTVLRRGTWRALAGGSGGHRVSVLLPVKNGARDLREQLPLLFAQRADAELELVAVDSGSRDDSVDVLAEADATILSIDPASFDHGLTRNLAAEHASGDVLVLLTHQSRPVGTDWLAPLLAALDADPAVAGACSRVTPHPHADPLTRRDGLLDPSGSPVRAVKRIADWDAYRHASPEERRLLLNFHTVSAALRADVVARIPFRQVRTIGEDLLWARDVLEAGLALTHEPASHAYHSHDYTLRERFMRNVDDGVANHDVAGRELPEEAVAPMIRAMVADDWAQLRGPLGLEGAELEELQIEAVLRRVAQVAGQWVGANHESLPAEVLDAFSRVATMRRAS